MLNSKDTATALEFASQLPEMLRSMRSGSLIEYTKPTRVEPVTLIDNRAARLPYIEDVMSTALNVFSAYYLQAVSLSVNVGQINVRHILGRLNPNRDVLDSLGQGTAALKSRYSSEGLMKLPFPQDKTWSQEASTSVDTKSVQDNANLSVGKLLDVNVKSGDHEAKFPIQVRLFSKTVLPDVMVHTLSLDSKKQGLGERIHKWRSGQIDLIKDLILCQDMVDAHRENLVKDASGYYQSRVHQKRKNELSAVLSGKSSIAGASSIFILTADTAKELERASRLRLDKFRDREKLFKETYAMLMFVVDPEWETVTIYHRSISDESNISVREMQRANKGDKGPDILDILNALRDNKAPSF